MNALMVIQRLSGGSEVFNDAVRRGRPFIWSDATISWPNGSLHEFDCGRFSAEFPHSSARSEKATGGVIELLGEKNWTHPEMQTFCGIEQAVPTVWHVKDEAPLQDKAKFLSLFPGLPDVLSPLQNAHLRDSGEVWLQPEGAGVLAHVDGYCSGLLSFQLRGRKLWKIMSTPLFKNVSAELFDDSDGGIYVGNYSSTQFIANAEIWLEEGDALYLPPGMIHETLSPVGGGCTVSVTALISTPLPTGYIKEFLPGMSILGDNERCMRDWAPMVLLRSAPDESITNFSSTRAAQIFMQIDVNSDGYLDIYEVQSYFRDTPGGKMIVSSSGLGYFGFSVARVPSLLAEEIYKWLAADTLGFWDTDRDGRASALEVRESLKLFMKNLFRSRLVSAARGNRDHLKLVDIATAYYDNFDFSSSCVSTLLFGFYYLLVLLPPR